MSDLNNVNKGNEQWGRLLPSRVKYWLDVLRELRQHFRRITLVGQVILAILGLGLAAYHVYHWQKRSMQLSQRIQSGLGAKLENTVWQHKGLAAYLLSDIEPASATVPGNSKEALETKNRSDVINEIEEIIGKQKSTVDATQETTKPNATPVDPSKSTQGKDKTEQEEQKLNFEAYVKRVAEIKAMAEQAIEGLEPEKAASAYPTPDPDQVGLHATDDVSGKEPIMPTNQALAAGGTKFFLFLPATALRRQTLSYKPLDAQDKAGLIDTVAHNPDIVLDLSLAAQLKDKMEMLDAQTIKGQSVVQSYFITESGLILIRSSSKSNQWLFYDNYFAPNHNFTDRAYFWGAIEASKGKRGQNDVPSPFDYYSEPYIDLGGHGLVKTYSKAFKLANGRYGVLCIDTSVPQTLRTEVEARLNVLKPDDATETFRVISIPIDKEGNVIEYKLPDDFNWFSERLKHTKPSSLLGRIASEDADTGDVRRYTIPWERRVTDKGVSHVQLMLVTINLRQFWDRQESRIAYICIGIIIFLAMTLNMLQDYMMLKKEISEFAEKVDEVMTHAIDPYVRLDNNNEFVSVNDSFVHLLNYKNPEDLSTENTARPRTFKTILTPNSQREYDKILKRSARGLSTNEYSITMYDKDGKEIRALVHGERIVFPSIRRKKYPHRFGIIISASDVNERGEETPIQLGKRVIEENRKRHAQMVKESKLDT